MSDHFKPLSIITSNGANKLTDKRDSTDEFNKYINAIGGLLDPKRPDRDEKSVREFQFMLSRLLTNEYFHLMYIHNGYIAEFIIEAIEISMDLAKEPLTKLEMMDLTCGLLQWDINLEKIEFRSKARTCRYRVLFEKLLPNVIQLIRSFTTTKSDQNPNANLLLMSTNEAAGFRPTSRRCIRPLIKIICFMLVCVPFQVMFSDHFVSDLFLATETSLISSRLDAQVSLPLAVNICHYGSGFSDNTRSQSLLEMCRNEDEKLLIFSQVSEKTVALLEKHVRSEPNRSLIKRALSIYCECMTRYIQITHPVAPLLIDPNSDMQGQNKWQACLYQVIISIVRILRLDFENQENAVDIELVIYFYEILKANMESLTFEDATSIAVKLMDILVKIRDWSDVSKANFNETHYKTLKALSYELADKFVNILRNEYSTKYWDKLESFWTEGVLNWEMGAYRIISTFCSFNRNGIEFFKQSCVLAQAVVNSWKINLNVAGECQCKLKPKKSSMLFFKAEILDAVADLIGVYDEYLDEKEPDFERHLENLDIFFQVMQHLFSSASASGSSKLAIIVKTYTKILKNVKSPLLKSANFWPVHLEIIMRTFNDLKTNFSKLEVEFIQASLELIELVYKFYDRGLVNQYDEVVREILVYLVNSQKNLIDLKQPTLEEAFPFLLS